MRELQLHTAIKVLVKLQRWQPARLQLTMRACLTVNTIQTTSRDQGSQMKQNQRNLVRWVAIWYIASQAYGYRSNANIAQWIWTTVI